MPVQHSTNVRRGYTKFIAKHLIRALFLVGGLAHPAVAQIVEHGTYFLAGFSTEYVVVAIDSRELSGAQVNDRYCKIRPLSSNAFFFATG